MKFKVLVLLSTYNGGQYLRDQLRSIYSQVGVDIDIMVRDDGSTDNTLEILREYQETKGHLFLYKGLNIGCKKSFYTLIKYASELECKYDLYAFSDQDDVWLPEKILAAVEVLKASDIKYKCYYSAAKEVDHTLHEICAKKYEIKHTFGSNIISNKVLGCTLVISASILDISAKVYCNVIDKPNIVIPYHDTYVALLSYAINAFVYYDKCSYILYRQHGNNLVGGSGKSAMCSQIDRFKRDYSRFEKIKILLKSADANLFPVKNLLLLKACANCNNSFVERLKLIFDRRLRTGSYARDIFFFINLLIGRW